MKMSEKKMSEKNYTVKGNKVIVDFEKITKKETDIVKKYREMGYDIVEKRTNKSASKPTSKLNMATILTYLYTNNDTEGLKAYLKGYETIKEGKTRKGGFLGAKKEFVDYMEKNKIKIDTMINDYDKEKIELWIAEQKAEFKKAEEQAE